MPAHRRADKRDLARALVAQGALGRAQVGDGDHDGGGTQSNVVIFPFVVPLEPS